MKKNLNPWCLAVRHAMLDRGLSTTDLARELGASRPYISSIVNGRVIAPAMIDKISDFLELTTPYSVHKSVPAPLLPTEVPVSYAPTDELALDVDGSTETVPADPDDEPFDPDDLISKFNDWAAQCNSGK